jgi:hypothetical protein
MQHEEERQEMHTKFFIGKLVETRRDMETVFKGVLNKLGCKMWARFVGIRTWSGGGGGLL